MSKNRQDSTRGFSNKKEKELWEYVNNQLPNENAHAQELENVDDPFWNDAVEGLSLIEDKEHIKKLNAQLQKQIKQRTANRKENRKKNYIQISLIAIFILLLIMIAGYLVTHFSIKK